MRLTLVFLLAIGVLGCRTPIQNTLEEHVLCFDERGIAIRPDGTRLRERGENDREYDSYIARMLTRADEVCDGQGEVRRLLIHVHGGLNTRGKSMRNADRIISTMFEDSGEDWYYPIFVTWPSGATSSYAQYVWNFRQGQTWPILGPATLPMIFVTDLARGVARAPRSLAYQILDDMLFQAEAWSKNHILPHTKNVEALYAANATLGRPYSLQQDPFQTSWLQELSRRIRYLVTSPAKILSQITVVDSFGHGAWQVMSHRISNLFHHPEEFNIQRQRKDKDAVTHALEEGLTGDLAFFLARLTQHVEREKRRGARYEITLVGHSMGAIVVNEALKRSLSPQSFHADMGGDGSGHEEEIPSLLPKDDIERIVYMAPACSVRDTLDSVCRFLKRHDGTTFHVLTLNSVAEGLESNYYSLVPDGSLLMWVDNFFTTPASHTERRLGVWPNLVQSLHLFEPVRPVFTATAFGVSGNSIPRRHGDFNYCPFWRREFWDGTNATPYRWNSKTQRATRLEKAPSHSSQ